MHAHVLRTTFEKPNQAAMTSLIDPQVAARLYTKTEYAKNFGLTRRTLDRRIEAGKVDTINIKGGTIIVAAPAK